MSTKFTEIRMVFKKLFYGKSFRKLENSVKFQKLTLKIKTLVYVERLDLTVLELLYKKPCENMNA